MFSPTVIRYRNHDDAFAVVITNGHGLARFQVYDIAFMPADKTYLLIDESFTTEQSAIDRFNDPVPVGGYAYSIPPQ